MKINFQDNFTWKEILKIDDNQNQYSTYDKNGYLQSANRKSTLSILA